MIVSQVGTSLIRTLDKGNCQNEFDHDNCAHRQSVPPFLLDLSSLAFSQNDLGPVQTPLHSCAEPN